MSNAPSETEHTTIPIATSADLEFYWLALGKFASRYAEVEWCINQLVRHYYKLDQQTANIIFGGALRVDAAFNHLQRLADAQRIPNDHIDEINELKNQLGNITRLRNDTMHYGAISNEDGIFVSNIEFAHIKERIRTHAVSFEILEEISIDLTKIYTRLDLLIYPEKKDFIWQTFHVLLSEPWRYKPDPQSSNVAKPQDSPPRRRRQRGSSPA